MTEKPGNPEQEPKPYVLYEDEFLQDVAEQGDEHLELLMRGLKMATQFANDNPDNPNFGEVVTAAEEGLRAWIERQGYTTQENTSQDEDNQP